MTDSWSSYPSIFALGHRATTALLTVPVIVEEKIDGSQFSFGLFDASERDGLSASGMVLRARSKSAPVFLDAPEKLFAKAAETVLRLAPLLIRNWTYRGEYLAKPRHNALAYNRVPAQHIILFDINSGLEVYLSPAQKKEEAQRLGLECVPLLYQGVLSDIAAFREFLRRESVLGGQPVEGVVVKPLDYGLFGPDKKCVMAKFVSEAYKEVQAKAWKADNPTKQDVLAALGAVYGTQARWMKAVQHLRDRGEIENSPQDIGKLIREAPDDIRKECETEIKEKLFAWAWPHIRRLVTRGLPEWYKEQLLKKHFEQADA